jgi:hypothetical protein
MDAVDKFARQVTRDEMLNCIDRLLMIILDELPHLGIDQVRAEERIIKEARRIMAVERG